MPSLDDVFDFTERLNNEGSSYMLIVMNDDAKKVKKSKSKKKSYTHINYVGNTFFRAKDEETACALISAAMELSEDIINGKSEDTGNENNE